MVETFTGITDEQFDALVDTHSKLVESAWPPGKNGEEDKKKKKKDEDEESDAGGMKKKYAEKADKSEAEETAEAVEEAKDAEALEVAEAEDSPALVSQSESEGETVIASLNQYFGEVLGGTNNEKES